MTSSTPGQLGRNRIYSISDLSREFGATARTLRFYEQQGQLLPGRRGWDPAVQPSRPDPA